MCASRTRWFGWAMVRRVGAFETGQIVIPYMAAVKISDYYNTSASTLRSKRSTIAFPHLSGAVAMASDSDVVSSSHPKLRYGKETVCL